MAELRLEFRNPDIVAFLHTCCLVRCSARQSVYMVLHTSSTGFGGPWPGRAWIFSNSVAKQAFSRTLLQSQHSRCSSRPQPHRNLHFVVKNTNLSCLKTKKKKKKKGEKTALHSFLFKKKSVVQCHFNDWENGKAP